MPVLNMLDGMLDGNLWTKTETNKAFKAMFAAEEFFLDAYFAVQDEHELLEAKGAAKKKRK